MMTQARNIQLSGTTVTIPASSGRRSGPANAPKAGAGSSSKTQKNTASSKYISFASPEDMSKHTYTPGEKHCNCDHDHDDETRLEDEDWSDMEDRGAWERD
ncbi:hypothetical protein B0T09DRAFT_265829 [Sordaria sp. MPI-SDFR-AT-0083]|nr:hypothetical protein B0T09DRAFT_265829 [Sordaria sp. MPI-SDFR-AT-0083]